MSDGSCRRITGGPPALMLLIASVLIAVPSMPHGAEPTSSVWTPAGMMRPDGSTLTSSLRTTRGTDSQVCLIVTGSPASTIEAAGGVVLESPAPSLFVARVRQGIEAQLRADPAFVSLTPYHAGFKIEATLRQSTGERPLELLLWPAVDRDAILRQIRSLGLTVESVAGDRVRLQADSTMLEPLARIEGVRALFPARAMHPMGEQMTVNVQSGAFVRGATPFHDAGIDGGGGGSVTPQVLTVIDSGIQLDAAELSDSRTDAGTPGPTHRKVRIYQSTDAFGGQGDLLGCDASIHGGYTHGHVISSAAVGRASHVEPAYGPGWLAFDEAGNPWELDGVAPGAVLVAYDAHVTPATGGCANPIQSVIDAGDLYDAFGAGAARGALGEAYEDHGARVFGLAWGETSNTYGADAQDIDRFTRNNPDALVVVSAGNDGAFTLPVGSCAEPGCGAAQTINSVGTAKSGLTVGSAIVGHEVDSRGSRSSQGPAGGDVPNRLAPLLMAPGAESGSIGAIDTEFTCRTLDDDGSNPVECDVVGSLENTSSAAAAAMGGALLVRDYFAQGFYPSGRANLSDQQPDISGALLRALLVASADFMTGENLFARHRFNNEQGYGRIQLDQVLPLEEWAGRSNGLIVHDTWSDLGQLPLADGITTGSETSANFTVCNPEEPLSVALGWVDLASTSALLRHDLNLTLVSPSGVEYRGNYFTDDSDRDGAAAPGEDCAAIGALDPDVSNGAIDEGAWSLPVCSSSGIAGENLVVTPFDTANPTEAIFLSPDPDGDGVAVEGLCSPASEINAGGSCNDSLDCRNTPTGDGVCVCEGCYRQTEAGEWTVKVAAGPSALSGSQDFALAISGGVCGGSSVRFDRSLHLCSEVATIEVLETADSGVVGDDPDATQVGARVSLHVIDRDPQSPSQGQIVDSESGVVFSQPESGVRRFLSSSIPLSQLTAREPGNGVLDVRHRDTLRVEYQDVDPDTGLAGVLRVNEARVDCAPQVGFGETLIAQFGRDARHLIQGGCERSARGVFEFGFPDRYMDAGESLFFRVAFQSQEAVDLQSVDVTLRCVEIDADSPLECPGSGIGCDPVDDARRENNPACSWLTVENSPIRLDLIPASAAVSASFPIEMAGDGPGQPFEDPGGGQPTPTVEMVLEVSSIVGGRARSHVSVSRHRLNVDQVSLYYSTDYPAGGAEILDHGNDEIAQNPTGEFGRYQFDTTVYSPLTSGGANAALLSPWNFDSGNGGFRHGLAAPTDGPGAEVFKIGNWGEDKNFNGIEDGVCVADPSIACFEFGFGTDPRCPAATQCLSLENNRNDLEFGSGWGTEGGCGWQTRAPGECSIDTDRGCFDDSDCGGVCQIPNNPPASTFDACGAIAGGCGSVQQCSDGSASPRQPCGDDADCGGTPGSCQSLPEACVGDAGNCGAAGGDPTGGVWHTGQIGAPGGNCNGIAGSPCANYKTVAGTGGSLVWWELLLTPVLERVNTDFDAAGLRTHEMEITRWDWNQSANLRDSNVAYSWEIDTDLARLGGADLFADTTTLNLAQGRYGLVNEGDPSTTGGWTMFAPRCSCTTAPFGTCTDVSQCSPGTCNISENLCNRDQDCDPGLCSVGTSSCFSDADCPFGICDSGGNGSALGDDCKLTADCEAVAGAGAVCTGMPGFCNLGGPMGSGPELCDGVPFCDCSAEASLNGSLGGNREGEDACFFDAPFVEPTSDLALAGPLDDDIDNDQDGRENPFGACDAASSNVGASCTGDVECDGGQCDDRCAISLAPCALVTEAVDCALAGDYCVPRSTSFDCADGISNEREGTCSSPAGQPCNVDVDCSGQCVGGESDLLDPQCLAWVDSAGEPHGIDEFVTPAGPIRNHSLSAFNGPDMQFDVLSDIYGDPGNSFQGAVGFVNFEGTAGSQAQQSFGLALDDMVVAWREYSFEADATDCETGGACAVVEFSQTTIFQGVGTVHVRLIEPSPPADNDCDLDGSSDGTSDCNGNSILDLVVRVVSPADPVGEILILDQSGASSYSADLPISTAYDSPGVLFVAAADGSAQLTAIYEDEDDGTGQPCPNAFDPAMHGRVEAATTVMLGSVCSVQVVDYVIADNGDQDVFPDTHETIAMNVGLVNNCGETLHNCTARIFSNSPAVDCILDSVIDVGDLQDTPLKQFPVDTFLWKVGAIERQAVDDELLATFNVTLTCDEVDGLAVPQSLSIPLDLDYDTFDQTPASWVENFESGTLGKFTAENLDQLFALDDEIIFLQGLAEGWRCQYSDPDNPNSRSYGSDQAYGCWPGASITQAEEIFWQVDGIDTSSPDGGRAKGGDYSLYYGVYLPAISDFTTPLAVVESVRTIEPINLGIAAPELSFWHQVSLMDGRFISIAPTRNADRGVVQIKTVDAVGGENSDWMRLEPYQNGYDTQNYDFFFNCMFDPIDDGSTEDDFFDPEDPNRRLGPSSTCHPQFTYSCLGNTQSPFDVSNICNATTAPSPSDAGSLGVGTWVETRIELKQFVARRVQLRFLVSAIKAGQETHEEQFAGVNPGRTDDGWWIDDVEVSDTFAIAVNTTLDSKSLLGCAGDPALGCFVDQDCVDAGSSGPCNLPAPSCGPGCSAPNIVVSTEPDSTGGALDETLPLPGTLITLDASTSSASCQAGALQFRFSDGGGSVLQPWSENAIYLDAPVADVNYTVEVRCSSDHSCNGGAVVAVNVECPTSGALMQLFPETILATSATAFGWSSPLDYDLYSGPLDQVSTYTGAVSSGSGNSFSVPAGAGPSQYYLLRLSGEFCNDSGSWSSAGSGESPGRDGALP